MTEKATTETNKNNKFSLGDVLEALAKVDPQNSGLLLEGFTMCGIKRYSE